jgi:hypothetical protein
MKKLGLILFLAISMVSFNGCINLTEVITLKKNGSGSYSLSYDMGSMISMLKDMNLGEMLGGEAGEDTPDISSQLPKMIDTTVYAANMLKATGKWEEEERKDFWEQVKVHTLVNQDKGIMTMTMFFGFKDVSDIQYFQNNMGQLTDGGGAMGGMGGMLGGISSSSDFLFKKRTFKRTVSKSPKVEPGLTDEMAQQMQMMKMMLSDATYKTTYNFPKKIKSTDIKGGVISKDKKTLIVETGLLDLMDNANALDGEVKFKRW